MGFHSRLHTDDLHAPTRLPVRNDSQVSGQNGIIARGTFGFVVNYSNTDNTYSTLPIAEFNSSTAGRTEMLGIAADNINQGQEGYLTTFGLAQGVTIAGVTSANRGDTVYIELGTTNLGMLTLDRTVIGATPVGIVLNADTSNLADIFVFSLESGFIRNHFTDERNYRGEWNPNTETLPTNSAPANTEVAVGDYFLTIADSTSITAFNYDVKVGDLFYVASTPDSANAPVAAGDSRWATSNFVENTEFEANNFGGLYAPTSATEYPVPSATLDREIIKQGTYWVVGATIGSANNPFTETLEPGTLIIATLQGTAADYKTAATNYVINLATGGGAATGEANTSSNLGTASDGEGLAAPKVNVDLPFKRIQAGAGISLAGNTNNVVITNTRSAGTTYTFEDGANPIPNQTNVNKINFTGPGVTAALDTNDDTTLLVIIPGGSGGTTYTFEDEGVAIPNQTAVNKINFTGDAVMAALAMGDATTLDVDINACTIAPGTLGTTAVNWTLGTSLLGTTIPFSTNNDGFRWSVAIGPGTITALCGNNLNNPIPISASSSTSIELTSITINGGANQINNVPMGDRTGTGSLTFNYDTRIPNAPFNFNSTNNFVLVATFTVGGVATPVTQTRTISYTNPNQSAGSARLTATAVSFRDVVTTINIVDRVTPTGSTVTNRVFPNGTLNAANTQITLSSANGIRRDTSEANRTLTETLTYTNTGGTGTLTDTYNAILSLNNLFFFPHYSGSIVPGTTVTSTTLLSSDFTEAGQNFNRPTNGAGNRLAVVTTEVTGGTTKIFSMPRNFRGNTADGNISVFASASGGLPATPVILNQTTITPTNNTPEEYDVYEIASLTPGAFTYFLEFN